jgi:UDP-N-acetylglucosamine/UDP-N-acetylgalactosamine diphosphorylase
MELDEVKVRARYRAAGQEHVLKHYGSLSVDDKVALLRQLQEIEVESLASLLETARQDPSSQTVSDNDSITPFSKHVGRTSNDHEASRAYEKGIAAIGSGEVAALVLAGGQGTRLGFSGPKGLYNIGLPSNRSLFQLLVERLLRLKRLAGDATEKSMLSDETPSLPFYIMTSPMNHEETLQYFKDNNYFGFPKNDIMLFQQGMLPCLTENGKIIMETACTVAMAPDG